jgi:hypothetical protein
VPDVIIRESPIDRRRLASRSTRPRRITRRARGSGCHTENEIHLVVCFESRTASSASHSGGTRSLFSTRREIRRWIHRTSGSGRNRATRASTRSAVECVSSKFLSKTPITVRQSRRRVAANETARYSSPPIGSRPCRTARRSLSTSSASDHGGWHRAFHSASTCSACSSSSANPRVSRQQTRNV